METSANVTTECFSPIYVEKNFDEFSEEQPCNFELQDGGDEWQEELEQFWDGRKHRISEFEQTQQLSSSLEKHLLFDEVLYKPEEEIKEQKDESVSLIDQSCIIRGEDIEDIPTQYIVNGFKPNEFIVVGTYIDQRVIPGFKYTVRKNLTEKYLFQGQSLHLTQIGQGYGKRLTFESPTLNENSNYFWSDSCAAGFGFSIQAVNVKDTFSIFDPALKSFCGHLVVKAIKGDQIEKATIFGENGRVEKIVSVEFCCNVVLTFCGNNEVLKDVTASGTAILVKENSSSVAEIETIKLSDFVVDGCELRPRN